MKALLAAAGLFVLARSAAAAAPAETPSSAEKQALKAEKEGRCTDAERIFAQEAAKAEGSSTERVVRLYSNLGAVRNELGYYQLAEDAYRRALALSSDGRTVSRTARAALFYNMGNVYERRDRYDLAEPWIRRAVREYEKLPAESASLGACYHTLGNVLSMRGRDEAALPYYRKARDLFRKAKDYPALSDACFSIANRYEYLKRDAQAWDYYQCSLDAAEKSGGLVQRRYRSTLERFSSALKRAGLADRARSIDEMVSRIDALPAPEPGGCRRTVTTTQ